MNRSIQRQANRLRGACCTNSTLKGPLMHAQAASITGNQMKMAFSKALVKDKTSSISRLVLSMLAKSENGIVNMTPGLASRILAETNFIGQRKLKIARVAERKLWIACNLWQPGFPITFVLFEDGTVWLVDGQHRLMAIYESGQTVQIKINVIEVTDERHARAIYSGFDKSDSTRSDSELLDGANIMERHGISRDTARSAFRAMVLLQNNMEPARGVTIEGWNARSTEARMQSLGEWINEIKAYETACKDAETWLKRKLYGAGCMAVALYTLRHQRIKAIEFWSSVANDDGLSKGDPRKTLLDDFKNRSNNAGNIRQSVQQPSLAWNAWWKGESRRIIKCLTDAPIQILGTPMAKGNK